MDFDDKGIRLKARRVAARSCAKREVSHFCLGFLLFMEDCAGHHVTCTQTPATERCLKITEIIRIVGNDLHDIVSGHSVPENQLS